MQSFGVRFYPQDIQILKEVCKARGEQVSDFIRRSTKKELAILGYLGKGQRKALGLNKKRLIYEQ